MELEKELEFDLLLSAYKGESRIENEKWALNLFEDGTIIGTLFVRPAEESKFLTVIVKSCDDDRFEGRFKPFSLIQEETSIVDFSETESSDSERRLLMFLLLNPEFIRKLDSKIKKDLLRKLRRI